MSHRDPLLRGILYDAEGSPPNLTISIIIPTYNRNEYLVDVLNQIQDSDIMNAFVEYEVIVVDDAHNDFTRSVVNSYSKAIYLQSNHAGPVVAKKIGFEESSGDLIGFLDDDVDVSGIKFNFIRDLICYSSADVVQTRLVCFNKNEKLELYDKKDIGKLKWNMFSTKNYNYGFRTKEIEVSTECGVFIKRSVLEDVAFYDDDLISDGYGEAISFSFRARQKGYKIYFEPRSVVYHYGPSSGGSVENFGKSRETFCTQYISSLVKNMITINKKFNRKMLLFVKVYFIIAGVYISLYHRKNCLKYFLEGIK